MKELSTKKTGELLRAFATHHAHAPGWLVDGNTGIVRIRYRSDFQGYSSRPRRLVRGLQQAFGRQLFGGHWWQQGSPLKLWYHIYFSIRANVVEDNRPDAVLNGGAVIAHWYEDARYIEAVGPTVGEKVAEFLTAEPENEHACAIAAEINRIWALSEEKSK